MSKEVRDYEDGTMGVEAGLNFENRGGDTQPHTTLFVIMSNHKNGLIPYDAPIQQPHISHVVVHVTKPYTDTISYKWPISFESKWVR